MPKPKKPVREMHRWEKMMAGATDMEELLVEILDCFNSYRPNTTESERMFITKIERQLKRTGRLK
jgi:hypothetical protein